ncbi:hypothetical protein AMECASPLE_037394 [Ameca splendens]|uniref:Uncharacterized protein n=1 Tax=Ameca splendens TaxID=208324 RepID=A0ABV0XWR6_9TELE
MFNFMIRRNLSSLLLRSIQVCVNTMQREKDISNYLREATGAADHPGMGYKAISKTMKYQFTEKSLKTAADLLRNGNPNKLKFRVCNDSRLNNFSFPGKSTSNRNKNISLLAHLSCHVKTGLFRVKYCLPINVMFLNATNNPSHYKYKNMFSFRNMK